MYVCVGVGVCMCVCVSQHIIINTHTSHTAHTHRFSVQLSEGGCVQWVLRLWYHNAGPSLVALGDVQHLLDPIASPVDQKHILRSARMSILF